MADRVELAGWRLLSISFSCTLQFLACTATESPASVPGECADSERSSFVILPDTQFYACGYPDIFESQTRWISQSADSLGIATVAHTGDVVDLNVDEQWAVAATALHQLDGRVPYVLAPGNHDIDVSRATKLDEYFGREDLDSGGCFEMGYMDDESIANAYLIVKLRGVSWLFLGLEFAPRDATLEWAAEVLGSHAEMPTVLFTHAYLYSREQRYDRAVTPTQPYHPDAYAVTPEQGIADGQDIWNALVEPHGNVKLVLSGHVVPDGIERSVALRQSGSTVHEVLTNFQYCEVCPCEEALGGGGYLRVVTMDESGNQLQVRTYSPYLDAELQDDENAFTLAL